MIAVAVPAEKFDWIYLKTQGFVSILSSDAHFPRFNLAKVYLQADCLSVPQRNGDEGCIRLAGV